LAGLLPIVVNSEGVAVAALENKSISGKRLTRRTRGAVDQLPSGRWRARFTTPDGRRLTASLATKRETDAWVAGHATDLGRGTWVDPHRGRSTLGEYATKWIDQRTDLRPRTADDYRDIRVHIASSLGAKQLGKLTPADVRSWYSELSGRVPGRPARLTGCCE
jgi:hypothetical protein